MAKGQKRSGKEPRKPTAPVTKTNASNPSTLWLIGGTR